MNDFTIIADETRYRRNAKETVTILCTPRAWLEHWPTARRSLISNMFHEAVRNGAPTPARVVSAVQGTLETRLKYASRPLDATNATVHAVWRALLQAPAEAYPYAQTVLDWEALPSPERQHQKQERVQHYQRQYMTQLPPTAKQLTYLRTLGYVGPAPANRAEASSLIETMSRPRQEIHHG